MKLQTWLYLLLSASPPGTACCLPCRVQERAAVSLRRSRTGCTTGSCVCPTEGAGSNFPPLAVFCLVSVCSRCTLSLPSLDLPSPTGKKGWVKQGGREGGIWEQGGRGYSTLAPKFPKSRKRSLGSCFWNVSSPRHRISKSVNVCWVCYKNPSTSVPRRSVLALLVEGNSSGKISACHNCSLAQSEKYWDCWR